MKRFATTAVWLVLIAGLCLPAMGQRRRGRFGGAGHRGAPAQTAADSATTALIEQMYASARRDVNSVPALMAPTLLMGLAEDEAGRLPDAALRDVTTAFNRALALPSEADSRAGAAREQIKAQAELMGVAALARDGHFDTALGLARRADVAKGPLYDVLIENIPSSVGGRGSGLRGFMFGFGGRLGARARPNRARTGSGQAARGGVAEEIFSLIEECQNADGTFPYRGVAGVLRWTNLDAISRTLLLDEGYQAAGRESDPNAIAQAMFLLESGHREMPEMDPELTSVLTTLVPRLQDVVASPSAAGRGMAPWELNRALALLRSVDPTAAAVLAGNTGWLNGGHASGLGNSGGPGGFAAGVGGGRRQHPPMYVNFSTTVRAPASGDGSEAVGVSEFRSLVTRAESQVRIDPNDALATANRAASLLDASLWTRELEVVARLATVYAELGDQGDAARLISRCLNQADRQGVAFDASYDDADAAAKAAMVLDGGAAESAILATYSLAARLDLETTAERAETSPMVLLKPLIQSRVALVAEAGERGAFGRGGRFGG